MNGEQKTPEGRNCRGGTSSQRDQISPGSNLTRDLGYALRASGPGNGQRMLFVPGGNPISRSRVCEADKCCWRQMKLQWMNLKNPEVRSS